MLTAHDHFADIIEEAQKGSSIFHAGNIIQVHEDDPEERYAETQLSLIPEADKIKEDAYAATGVEKTALKYIMTLWNRRKIQEIRISLQQDADMPDCFGF